MKLIRITVFSLLCVLAWSGSSPCLAHEHHAPHHGVLCEVGEEFAHLEFLLDAQAGKLTAYSLDGEAENPVRLSQKCIMVKLVPAGRATAFTLNLKAVANELSGEKPGDSSEFSAISHKLKGLERFEGSVLILKIKGQPFKNLAFSYPQKQDVGKNEKD